MKINVHVTVSDNSLPYYKYMEQNYRLLKSESHDLHFFAYCLDDRAFQVIKSEKSAVAFFLGSKRGTTAHCDAAKAAFEQVKSLRDDINIIADSDTVVLQKDWDVILVDALSTNKVLGSTYEPFGGFSSGTGNIQTYKNIPTLTWFAMSPNVDFSGIDLTPYKGSHLEILDDEMSEIYQLPKGFFLLRDTGWQIPKYLYENNISYKILTHEKPTKTAKVLKSDRDYHEEYQLDGLPFMAHQRGSMSQQFRVSELSSTFYSTLDAYFSNLK